MMQSTQSEYLNDPALLMLLQSLGNQASQGIQQEDQQQAQQQSLESILQQMQLLQAFQELSNIQQQQGINKDSRMQVEEDKEDNEEEDEQGKRDGDENSDQATQQGQQNLPSTHGLHEEEGEILEKEIDSSKESKRNTISILGMDPSTEASLCQELFNSLIQAAAGQQIEQSQTIVQPNNQLLPPAFSIDKTTIFQVQNPQQDNKSYEDQLLSFLQSCLTLDQVAQATAAATMSSSTANTLPNWNNFNLNLNLNNNTNSNESTLTHKKHIQLLQTPTSSSNGFRSANDTTTHNNQQWSGSNSKNNIRPSNDVNILSSVNANLSAYFNNINATTTFDNKSTSISQTPSIIQHTFIPSVLSPIIQLDGFESLDSLAATQLSLQALIASGLNDPTLLRFQQQKRLERQFKIERYKNKRRNWIRKISYDCRKRVADSRLRVKGRFISKKDTQNIKPNGIEESSYQTDNYVMNSNFSDHLKLNNDNNVNMRNTVIVGCKYNTNSERKSDEIRHSSDSCIGEITQHTISLRRNVDDAIKQRIKDKKPLFKLQIHQKQTSKDNINPSLDNQCLPLLDNSNQQYPQLQSLV